MEVTIAKVNTLLEQKHHIALTTHRNPDGDALGSMLALYHMLQKAGKNAAMYLDDDIQTAYAFLPGIESIRKVYDGMQVDLWIVLDIDVADSKRLGVAADCIGTPVLNIDHHITNSKSSDYCILDIKAAATGELVWKIVKNMRVAVDETCALLVFVALATDCGFFRFANTNAETFKVASELVEYGAKPNIIARALEKRSLSTFQALSAVMETLEIHGDGKVALVMISNDLSERLGGSNEIVINNLRLIDSVEFAIVLREKSADEIRISMRTHEYSAVKIAQLFGGGGHMRAAGCTIAGTLAEAKDKILKAVLEKLCGH